MTSMSPYPVAAKAPQTDSKNIYASKTNDDVEDIASDDKSFIDLILEKLSGLEVEKDVFATPTDTKSEAISKTESLKTSDNIFDKISFEMTPENLIAALNPIQNNKIVTIPASKLGIHKNENSLSLLQIALSSQTTDVNGNILLTDTQKSVKKIETQLDLTNKVIDQLKNIIPENSQKDGILSNVLTRLQTKSETLQASLSTLENGVITKNTAVDSIPSPVLTALGLNPSQISSIAQDIQNLEIKLNREVKVEDLIIGVEGVLAPAQTSVLASVIPQSPTKILEAIKADTQPTDDIAAQLNALNVGTGDDSNDVMGFNKPKETNENLKDLQNIETGTTRNSLENLAPSKKIDNKDSFINLINLNKANTGDIAFPASFLGADTTNGMFQQFGLASTPSLNFGSVAQSANIIATTAMAGQSHPATNLVTAQILKYAPNGNDQTFNLRLDPPELGAVNVRLKFGKENSVKAHITIEKPETFMMLSRDIHSLERALQQAGFDTNGGGLSFELSSQGDNPFNNNGEGEGNGRSASSSIKGQGLDDSASHIESAVNWQVDPSSGHVRYNLFV